MIMKIFIGVVLCLFAINANAALVSADWQTSGDNLITRDTETGLDWLELTETTNMSYEYVTSQLGVGGQFEGWSYATTVQISSLFDSAGGTGPYDGWSSRNNGVVEYLLNLWGSTTGFLDSSFMSGDLNSPFGDPARWYHRIGDQPTQATSSTEDFMLLNVGASGDSSSTNIIGSALIRVSPVPVPSAVWLFVSGLIGLVGFTNVKFNG